jgi:hypothetical protein
VGFNKWVFQNFQALDYSMVYLQAYQDGIRSALYKNYKSVGMFNNVTQLNNGGSIMYDFPTYNPKNLQLSTVNFFKTIGLSYPTEGNSPIFLR